MRGVFDNLQVMAPGQRPDTRDVSDLTAVVNRHDRGNRLAGGQRRLYLPIGIRDIEIEIFSPAISEDRARAEIPDDLRRGGEGHRRDDDTLTGLEADGFQREVQCSSAGIDRDGVPVFEVI